MTQLFRYLLRQLVMPLMFIAAALTGVIWLTQSLRFVDKIINEGLGVIDFVRLTGMLMPSILALVLPISLFLAVLVTYNRLRGDSELLVMWAAGCSRGSLARPALALALIVVLICYGLVLYLAPTGVRSFTYVRYDMRANLSSLLLQEGAFNNLNNGITAYVRERRHDGELMGILVHDARKVDAPVTLLAERGRLEMTDKGPSFVLVNGNRQIVSQSSGNLSLLYFDYYNMEIGQYGTDPDKRWLEASERYLPELLFPDDSGSDKQHYWNLVVAGHKRMVGPLYALLYAMVALIAILTGEFNRRGNLQRILAASGIVVAFELAAHGIANLAIKTPPLIPAMYLIVITALGIAGYLLLLASGRRAALPAQALPGTT